MTGMGGDPLAFSVYGDDAIPGLPWRRHTVDDSSIGADGVRLRDVNGDGLPDIATGWEEGNIVRAYLHPGIGRVRERWPAVTVRQVGSPENVVFADLDGSGRLDVVSSCEGRVRTMFVHWAPADPDRYLEPQSWTTEPIPASQGVTAWMFCQPMELDGRNGIGLVAGSKNPHGVIGWFGSPRDPRDLARWSWHPLFEATWVMSLIAADMDGDGDLDILASDRKTDFVGRPGVLERSQSHRGPISSLIPGVGFADAAGA